jgi:hypothetical protein
VLIWNDDKSYSPGDILRATDVQLEQAGAATAFDVQQIASLNAICQRYYCKDVSVSVLGYAGAGAAIGQYLSFPGEMRNTPNVTLSGGTYSNASAATASPVGAKGFRCFITVTSSGIGYLDAFTYTASAEI